MVNHTHKTSSSTEPTLSSKKGQVGIKNLKEAETKMNKKTRLSSIGKMNKRGSLMDLPVNLLMLFIAVTFLIALIPAFVEMQDMAQQSDSMNCKGFVYNGNANDPLSYNATIGTKSSIGCMAIKLYLPYIVLGVLIAGVAIIFYGRQQGQQQGGY